MDSAKLEDLRRRYADAKGIEGGTFLAGGSLRGPIAVPGALKAVIYIGLAGTFILGVYPQWFMNQVVLATSIFSGLGPTPIVSHFPFGGSSPHFH